MTRRVVCALATVVLAVVAFAGCGSSGTDNSQGSASDRALLESTVHSAALGLAALAVNSTTGAVDQSVIRNYVHNVTFLSDNSGYFFSYDFNTNYCVAHWKNRDWEGTDKTSYQDSRGTYVVQELSRIAKATTGKGFLIYYWNNPVTNLEERKLGYIEVIPGTTIYIGSGIYIP